MSGEPYRPCPRCGVMRKVKPTRPESVCRDCLEVLSGPEKAIWRGQPVIPVVVEPQRDECGRGHSLADAYLAHRSDGRVTRRCRVCAGLKRKEAA